MCCPSSCTITGYLLSTVGECLRLPVPSAELARGTYADRFGYVNDDPPIRFISRDLQPLLPTDGVWVRYDLGKSGLYRPRITIDVPPGTVKKVSDVESGHWAYSAIQSLAARQALSFAEDGSYAPSAPTTRIDLLGLLVKALGIQPSTGPSRPFSDVAAENDETAMAAFQAGLVVGTGTGKLEPHATVTREQLAVLLIRAMNQYYASRGQTMKPTASEAVLQRFADAQNVSGWASEEVAQAVEAGLLIGRGAGGFSPQAPVTHAEAAVAVQRLLQWIER